MAGFTRRVAALLASSLLVGFMSACGNASDPESAAGAASTPAKATSAAAETSDPRLPEGTYRTPELTREQLLAAGVKAGLTEAQAEQALAGGGIEKTATFALKIESGRWTQLESIDSGPDAVGFRATYEVIDDGTVVTTEECCGESSFGFALEGDALRLTVNTPTDPQMCQDEPGCLSGFIVWESAPFSRV